MEHNQNKKGIKNHHPELLLSAKLLCFDYWNITTRPRENQCQLSNFPTATLCFVIL
jgi:hypothetical protein